MKQGLDGIFSNRIMIENINLTMKYRRLLTRIFLLGNFSCMLFLTNRFHDLFDCVSVIVHKNYFGAQQGASKTFAVVFPDPTNRSRDLRG